MRKILENVHPRVPGDEFRSPKIFTEAAISLILEAENVSFSIVPLPVSPLIIGKLEKYYFLSEKREKYVRSFV